MDPRVPLENVPHLSPGAKLLFSPGVTIRRRSRSVGEQDLSLLACRVSSLTLRPLGTSLL